MSHLWPSISPFNVWQLDLPVWLLYADACDAYVKQMREASRG